MAGRGEHQLLVDWLIDWAKVTRCLLPFERRLGNTVHFLSCLSTLHSFYSMINFAVDTWRGSGPSSRPAGTREQLTIAARPKSPAVGMLDPPSPITSALEMAQFISPLFYHGQTLSPLQIKFELQSAERSPGQRLNITVKELICLHLSGALPFAQNHFLRVKPRT